jgi:hypothetical protein
MVHQNIRLCALVICHGVCRRRLRLVLRGRQIRGRLLWQCSPPFAA